MSNEFYNKVYVRDLKEHFGFEQISGNEDSLNRWIVVPDINRPGLELSGFLHENDLKRVIILGNKELEYIKTINNSDILYERFSSITDGYTPCIVISSNNECPKELLDVANTRNFPIFRTYEKTYRASVQIIAFLDEKLAPFETCHGVLMNVYGVGIMIMGESGIGKSELALDLVKRGHMLVADDRVDIYRVHNDLIGKAPEILANMLEIRGIGPIDVSMMYGATSTLKECKLDLIIELAPYHSSKLEDRLALDGPKKKNILGLDKPLLSIPVKEGRQMGVIIESACANHRLATNGYDSAKIFEKRVNDYIKNRKDS